MFKSFGEREEEDKIDGAIINIIALQYMLTGIAMLAMAFAFITGSQGRMLSSHLPLLLQFHYAPPVYALLSLCLFSPRNILNVLVSFLA